MNGRGEHLRRLPPTCIMDHAPLARLSCMIQRQTLLQACSTGAMADSSDLDPTETPALPSAA